MKKGNRILALFLVFAMMVGFLPSFEIGAFAADEAILKFTYGGTTEYSIFAGQNGSGDGVSWTCDANGNVTFEFTKVGTQTFTVTKGNLNITSVNLTGGGAGGSAAKGGLGSTGGTSGAGGGGGEIKTVTGISGFKTGDVGAVTITVGAGGKGAKGSYSAGCSADYEDNIQCGDRGGYTYVVGNDGSATSITAGSFTYTAAGGKGDEGAASIHGSSNGNDGIPATATRAAGGASGGGMNYWNDSTGMAGTYNYYSYTCFLCGENCQRNFNYNVIARWYDPEDGRFYDGGKAVDGGGKGGDPGNDHNCGGRSPASNNGGKATAYGAGGGGSSYCTGYFGLGHHSHSGTGSTATHYFVGGGGGDGYQGIAKLGGKIDLVTIKIVKTSDDGVLSGHKFIVTDTKGNTYDAETDENGVAIVDGLDEGNYTVAEVQSDSYMPVSGSQSVSAPSSGTYTVNFENTAKKLSVYLTKKDADNGGNAQGNASIVGAEYTLYSYTGTKENPQDITAIQMKPILATGKASWTDLTLAKTYFIQETKAAPGYQLDPDKHFIDFDPASSDEEYNEINVDVVDKVQLGKIQITKVDSVITTPQGDGTLQGAVFEIYNRSAAPVIVNGKSYAVDEKIEEVTTNANGIATSSDLPYGSYEVIEKTSPVGYIVKVHSAPVDNYMDGVIKITTNVTVNEDIQRATLTVLKQDINGEAATGDATLAGAEFQIINSSTNPIALSATQRLESDYVEYATPSSTATNGDYIYNVGSVICTLTTKDAAGTCEVIDVPYGSYTIHESKAPTGYLPAADQKVTVYENGKTIAKVVIVKETPISATITVNKFDSVIDLAQGDTSLAGAVFAVYNKSAATVYVNGTAYAPDAKICEITTNASGKAVTAKLPYGQYQIVEVNPPQGYINENYSITVDIRDVENNGNRNVTFKDDVARAALTVSKNDINSGATPEGNATLGGAQFQIKNISANPITVSAAQRGTSTYITWATPSSTATNGDYIYNKDALICTLISKDDTGACDPVELPYGTYLVHESVAPGGYLADAEDQTVTLYENGKVKAVTIVLKNTPKSSTVTVNKKDAETGTSPQGDGTLAGMTFEIYNVSQYPIYYKGKTIEVNGLVDTLTTDEHGDATSDPLPFGRYRVVETKAPHGYEIPIDTYYEEGENYDSSWNMRNVTITMKDEVKRGDLRILKYDTDTYDIMQGDATFAGTVFEVYNASDAAIYIANADKNKDPSIVYAAGTAFASGSTYAPNALIATVTTGGAGDVTMPNLPYGRYRVVETVPPVGYLLNDGDVYDVVITNYDKKYEIIANVEAICEDSVKRGHWTISKTDDYTGTTPEGAAKLAGAKFSVINKSEGPIWFVGGVKGTDGTDATSLYQPDELVQYIYTNSEGKAVTGDLPYGRYLIQEEGAPEGYLVGIGDGNEGSGAMTGTLANYDTDDIIANQDITLKDSVKRGDFQFSKKGQAAETLANVVFRVTSTTTGESHIIVTDVNGEFNSSSTKFLHSDNTNCNDACVADDGTIDEDNLNPNSGIWFTGLANETLDPNDNRGALPYDTYIVEELRCKANTDLELLTFKVTVAVGGYTIDYGSMTDLNPTVIYSEFRNADTLTHSSKAAKSVSLIETIDLHSVVRGRNYTITCTLVNAETGEIAVDAQGNQLIETKTVKATATEMSNIKIKFKFDASNLLGVTLVATDVLTYEENGKTITAAVHDLTTMIGDDLEDQSVGFPGIATTLKDDKGEKEVFADTDATLVDEVAYKGLDVTKTYKITGTLVSKLDGSPVKNTSGTPVEASVVFTPDTPDGFVLVTFEHVDLSTVAGQAVVAFETLAYNAPYEVLYEHKELDDEAQTVYVPKIRTTAVNENELKNIDADVDQTIIDTIAYENLLPNTEYRIETDIIDIETGDSILDDVMASVFTSSDTGSGAVSVTVTGIDATDLAGKTVVVFEKLIRNNEHDEPIVRAEHADDTDEQQFIFVPEVRTTATGEDSQKEVTISEDITKTHVTDLVVIENAVVGETYKIEGNLYNKNTGALLLDASGNPIVTSVEFVATEADFNKEITFEFDASALVNGESLVAFEYLYEIGADAKIKLVAKHESPDDEDQTVYVPSIRTTVHDEDEDTNVFLAGENVTIVDTVAYKGLIPGTEYTMNGTLVYKDTGKPITDKEGNEVTASTVFTPDTADGEVDVVFVFDASELEGKSAVAFEVLTKTVVDGEGKSTDIPLVKHEDTTDEDQTAIFPSIESFAVSETDTKFIPVTDETKIIDKFEYTNFPDGGKYVLKGTLYDTETGEVLKDSTGADITVEANVTAGDDWFLEYVIEPGEFVGMTIVCTTEVYDEFDRLVAVENNLEDEDEMVYLPKLGTRAASVETVERAEPQLINADDYVEFIDFVDYENLVIKDSEGKKITYTVVGKLYDVDTDSFIVANGEEVIAMAKLPKSGLFTKPSESGTVEVKFPALNIEALAGHTLVVFESLYLGEYDDIEDIPDDALVYEHDDKDDEAQTLYIPAISTTLESDKGLSVVLAAADSTLTDTVEYSNLIPGKEYTMVAKLYNKTESKLTDFSASVTFTPDAADGTVDVVFDNIDLTEFAGSTFVCFEYLYIGTDITDDDDIRGEHEDEEDEDQTVYLPEIRTTAKGENGEKLFVPEDIEDTVKIIDTVDYTNLTVDADLKYTMVGTLMFVDTNEPVKDAEGKALTSKVEFVPTAADGSVDVIFEVPIADVAGHKLVVYETLYCEDTTSATPTPVPVAQHRDLNDEGQTVEIRNLGKVTKVDGTTKEVLPGVTIKVVDVTNKTAAVPVGEFITNDLGEIYFPIVPEHTYEFFEVATLDGYELDSTHYTMKADKDGKQTGDDLLVNWKVGTVVLLKVDSITGKPVEGATIEVYRQTNKKDAQGKTICELVFTQVTDEYGRIYFYPDAPGDYCYRETVAPAGYYLDTEVYTFTVKSDMTATGTLKFNNSRIGTIVLKKTDENGRILPGAVISIYNGVTGARLGTARTDEFGRVYFVSPGAGSYYFIEEEAPKGYLRDKDKHSFTVSADGTVSGTTTLVNKKDPNPQTGDYLNRSGWAIAAAIGTALTLGGVSLLIIRKRKAQN